MLDFIIWRGCTVPRFPPQFAYVYLICFHEPYKHAKHYLGSTINLDTRLEMHRTNQGARLLAVVNDAGISWSVSKIWRCESPEAARLLESRLKGWHHDGRLCPHCQHKPLDVLASLYYGHWPFSQFDQAGKRRALNEQRPVFVRRLQHSLSVKT